MITVLLISALSVSGAIFIILEMSHPLQRHDQSFQRADAQGPGTSGPVGETVDRALRARWQRDLAVPGCAEFRASAQRALPRPPS